MVVFFFIIVLVVIAGIGVLWASNLPGDVLITFGPQNQIEVQLVVALLGVLLALLWWAVVGLLRLPTRFSRAHRDSKVKSANKSLADGLLAAEAGDAAQARRLASRAEKYADDDRLKLLLEARTAEITDDWADAERAWGQLARLPGGQLAGLKGAATSARARGDTLNAEARAREAIELKSGADWPFNALFDSQVTRGEWQNAIDTLAIGEKRNMLAADMIKRRRAVLQTALAMSLPNDQRKDTQKLLADAIRSTPAFPPAAWHGARQLMMDDKVKPAQGVLELAWKARPHPALSNLSRRLSPDDSPESQRARLQALVSANPDHRESRILKAEIAMADRDWLSAVKTLALLVEESPTARLCMLLDQALRGYGDDTEAVRWGRMAATASREPEWSDIDPKGAAFEYDAREWARLVYAFGDASNLIHPRYETYARELEAGRNIALPAPARVSANRPEQVSTAVARLPDQSTTSTMSAPPLDYAPGDDNE